MNQNTTPVGAGSQAASANSHVNPNVLDWEEIKCLGLDPAPAGLAADDDQSSQS